MKVLQFSLGSVNCTKTLRAGTSQPPLQPQGVPESVPVTPSPRRAGQEHAGNSLVHSPIHTRTIIKHLLCADPNHTLGGVDPWRKKTRSRWTILNNIGDSCSVERQCSGSKEGPLACQELPRGDAILAKKRRVNGRQPGKQTGCPGREK